MAKAESETVEWAGWEHICGHSQGSCSQGRLAAALVRLAGLAVQVRRA